MSTISRICSRSSGSNTTISSIRFTNSGRKKPRTSSRTSSRRFSAGIEPSRKIALPRFEVMITIVLRKSTVRPVAVGEPAVVEQLEQDVEHVAVRLLDLVEQHDRVRAAPDRLGQLAALLVPDVAGRRADQARHRVPLLVLAHVDPHHRALVVEQVLGERARELGLAHAGRPEEQERADRSDRDPRARRGSAGSRSRPRSRPRPDRRPGGASASSRWTSFCISPSIRRATGMPVHVETTSATSSSVTSSFSILRSRWSSSSRAFSCSSSFSSSTSRPKRSSAARSRSPSRSARSNSPACSSISLFSAPDPVDPVLLLLPVRLHAARSAPAGRRAPARGARAAPATPGRVSLRSAARSISSCLMRRSTSSISTGIESISIRRRRRRLVDQVDRLVGQEPPGHVAVRQDRGGDQRRVLDPDAVVDLVALLQPAQDRDRVLDARLVDEHRLEPPLERRILLDVLAVLVERRRADRAELAAREHRLQHVAGVHRALGRAGTDDRVELVDERDDLRPRTRRSRGARP